MLTKSARRIESWRLVGRFSDSLTLLQRVAVGNNTQETICGIASFELGEDTADFEARFGS